MRAVVVLLVGLQFFAQAVRAETQVKAEDCSSAVSGTMIGSHIEVHCLSKEDIARVIDELVRQGVVKRAEDAGIETSVIVSLAARLKPTQKLDFAQAVVEVSHAVDIAKNVVAEGSSGSGDQLVDEVLKRIAEKTKANDPAGATREAEDGFTRWEKDEAERQASALASGVALLEAALQTDLLRFDAAAAAGRVEKIASLQHKDDPKALFETVRTRREQFVSEGRDKGVNFSLIVAIGIARRETSLAQGPDQHSAALNDLGIALEELGERDNGTARLDEAVTAFDAALLERTRERVSPLWAQTQNNLGNALARLGEREYGTARLAEAVAAYRAALLEWTRERVPPEWAQTQNNLGNALLALGGREHGTARLEEAVVAYRAALEENTRERVPLDWAATQNNLGNALFALGQLESGTATLKHAVAAYRSALEERTRGRVPLDWAQTQHNLGNALLVFGQRESGTARLDEAVAAFDSALEEEIRERVPLLWAQSFGGKGLALVLIADRTNDAATAEIAVSQIETAKEALLAGGDEASFLYFEEQLTKAKVIRDRIKGK
jgi:tetratricopeptide (TPR) repeat protein